MISRSTLNTVGRRDRSSSVNVASPSGTNTVTAPGARRRRPAAGPAATPARSIASRMTGISTRPRSLSARAVTCLPRQAISTGGFT